MLGCPEVLSAADLDGPFRPGQRRARRPATGQAILRWTMRWSGSSGLGSHGTSCLAAKELVGSAAAAYALERIYTRGTWYAAHHQMTVSHAARPHIFWRLSAGLAKPYRMGRRLFPSHEIAFGRQWRQLCSADVGRSDAAQRSREVTVLSTASSTVVSPLASVRQAIYPSGRTSTAPCVSIRSAAADA